MKRRVNPYLVAVVCHLTLCAALVGSLYGCEMHLRALAAESVPQEVFTPPHVETTVEIQESTPKSVEISNEDILQDATSAEIILAKTVWGEARGCSVTEQAAVVWCILNRVDSGYGCGSIIATVLEPNQFVGYHHKNPLDKDILRLVKDVLVRWELEDTNSGEVGRVLPEDYLWFSGDGKRNYFRNAYEGGTTWDWSLPSPYGEEWED